MKNLSYRSIRIILACFYTISLSGCGMSALTDAMAIQREQMAMQREQMVLAQKQRAEEQKLAIEERRLAFEERKREIERRNRQAEEQRQRQKEDDEWYRNLPPDQQIKIRLEKEKQNTALMQGRAAQEEQGASTMQVGAKIIIKALDQ